MTFTLHCDYCCWRYARQSVNTAISRNRTALVSVCLAREVIALLYSEAQWRSG